jgi:type IV secretory pathway TrbL component
VRGRLLLIAGLITGFVLGSRAGRRAYEQLRSRVRDVGRTPAVQSTVSKAREFAQQRAPKLTGAVAGVTETAAGVTESVHQAGEQAVVPVADTPTEVQPVGAEQTGTDAAGGGEIGESPAAVGPVGAEATTGAKEADDVER